MLRARFVHSSCRVWIVACLFVAGCGVQEDRTIEFSPDGKSVTFQHGHDGVFINEDGELKKLAVPDEDVVASSTPLWSPEGDRVVFQTARLTDANQQNAPVFQDWNDAVEGRVFLESEAIYTCWLYDKGSPADPRKVLTAKVPHVGLIAANLAVRWSNDGARLIFSDVTKKGLTGLFEWDLTAAKRRQWDIPAAREIVFDVNPHTGNVVAVAAHRDGNGDNVELHYLNPQGTTLWKKELAHQEPGVDTSTQINFLRQMKPVWSPNGERFAFILPPTSETIDDYQLQVCDVKDEAILVWKNSTDGLHDIAWSPGGKRLAVLDDGGRLWIGSEPGAMQRVDGIQGLRRFAGWSFDGRLVAGVSAVPAPFLEREKDEVPPGVAFMRLLVAMPTVGDEVMLADGETFENSRPVFDGMTVTFPKWSPTARELSLWVTFTPRYVSLPGMLLGGGLRPGDPAAKLDVETGDLEWMAVNPFEFVQIGHYYAMRGEYGRAAEWYEKAREEAGPPLPPQNLEEFRRGLIGRRNFAACEALVLAALGRNGEAAERLAEFDAAFFPVASAEDEAANAIITNLLGPPGSFLRTILREASLAEAALNLNLVGRSAKIFRTRLQVAETDSARLAMLAVISQLLLAEDARSEYLAFMSEEFLPVLQRMGFSFSSTESEHGIDAAIGPLVVGLSAIPLCHTEFFRGIDEDQLRQLATQWETTREEATTEARRALIDCGLASMYGQLGDQEQRQHVLARLEASPTRMNGVPLNEALLTGSEDLVQLSSRFGQSQPVAP